MKYSIIVLSLIIAFLGASCTNSTFKASAPVSSDAHSELPKDGLPGIDNAESGNGIYDSKDSNTQPFSINESRLINFNLDLIIAFDSSGSMGEEAKNLAANLNKLILALSKAAIDTRVHLIFAPEVDEDGEAPAVPALSFPPDLDGKNIAIVAQEVDSNNALSRISSTLAGLYANSYRDIKGVALPAPLAFRAGSRLEVLVISDDNGLNETNDNNVLSAGNTAPEFLAANKTKPVVSGIIGLPTSVQAAGVCELAAVGQEYITLATQTGGTLHDICAQDWSVIIDRYSKDVVKRQVSLQLSKSPSSIDKIVVSLNGKVLVKSAWNYDASTNLVSLSDSVPLLAGSELKVSYEAAP